MSYPIGKSWLTQNGDFLHCSGSDHWACLLNNEEMIKDRYGVVLNYDPAAGEDAITTDLWNSVKDANWMRFVGNANGLDFTLPAYSLKYVSSNVLEAIESILFGVEDDDLLVDVFVPMSGRQFRFKLGEFLLSGMNLREFLGSRKFASSHINWYKLSGGHNELV